MEQKKNKAYKLSTPFKPPNTVGSLGGWGHDFTGCLALLAIMVIPGSQYSVFIVVISYKARESQNKDHCCCNVSVLITDLITMQLNP